MHLSSRRDNFDLWSTQKCSTSVGHFLLSLREQLSLPFRASEVYFVSEVIFDSEVLPNGKVGKLNFTWCIKVAKQLCTNFTACNFTFAIAKTSPLTYVHIFKEYKAKMYETIERDNQTTRVDKLACQRASADCSASVLRKAKQSA